MKPRGYRVSIIKESQETTFIGNDYFLNDMRKFHLGAMRQFSIGYPSLDMVNDRAVSVSDMDLILDIYDRILFGHKFHQDKMFLSNSLDKGFLLIDRPGII